MPHDLLQSPCALGVIQSGCCRCSIRSVLLAGPRKLDNETLATDRSSSLQLFLVSSQRHVCSILTSVLEPKPQLEAMQNFVREGDRVYCHSMDRLARNLDDLRRIVLRLTERGVHIVFVKKNLNFTGEDSPMSNLLLSVMGAFAQFERELIRERQREGIEIRKAGREVLWQEAVSDPRAGGRVATTSSRWWLEGCVCS
jgi:hypothetical protein